MPIHADADADFNANVNAVSASMLMEHPGRKNGEEIRGREYNSGSSGNWKLELEDRDVCIVFLQLDWIMVESGRVW
jgi:hypothetical protein